MKLEPQAAAGQPIEPNAQSSFLLLYYGSSLHCLYLMLSSEEQSIEQYISNHVHVHVRMCSPALRVWGYLDSTKNSDPPCTCMQMYFHIVFKSRRLNIVFPYLISLRNRCLALDTQ